MVFFNAAVNVSIIHHMFDSHIAETLLFYASALTHVSWAALVVIPIIALPDLLADYHSTAQTGIRYGSVILKKILKGNYHNDIMQLSIHTENSTGKSKRINIYMFIICFQ